jgi:site-specific DNA-methyltransferase (adenine-specific)
MRVVDLADVIVGQRQRSNIATGPLNDLKESILGRGLLNPPVFWFNDDKKWELVAGERRLRALSEISGEKKPYRCGMDTIMPGQIAITPLGDYLDEIGRFEAELDENVQRVDLDWPDRMRAYAALHAMRQKSNPKQTKTATADEIGAKAGYAPGSGRPAALLQQAIVLEPHLNNPKIANARNAAEAVALVYKAEEERVLAALIKRNIAAAPKGAAIEIRHADLFDLLPRLDSGTFDLIIADPPYGIEASGAGFRARAVHHHNYRDDLDSAKTIANTILTEGIRLTKPRGNIFIFCDIDLFPWLKLTAANMGWTVFRRPLIWMKSESEGLAPWGGQGPRITTEFIFYATKGQRGLNASPVDVFDDRRVSRETRTHAAEKPVSLLKALINCASLPGDRILDPCCGSGSTLVAAKELQRQALGIEKDLDYYNTALSNVFGSTVKSAGSSK